MQRFIFQRLILTLAIVFCASLAFAQDNDIKGFVYEESTGEPMMFTNVFLKGTTLGCSTTENGYFNITRIPDGHYTLCITCVGYDTLTDRISLSHGQTITKKYTVKELWHFLMIQFRDPISIKRPQCEISSK